MQKVGVSITTSNSEQKIKVYETETDSLLGATRIINTFEPKKGYEVVYVGIDVFDVLL